MKALKLKLAGLLKADQRGAVISVVMAMTVVLVSAFSNVALLNLIQTDYEKVMSGQDAFQMELLLRTENERAMRCIESNANLPIPDRRVEIVEPQRTTTYYLETVKQRESLGQFMGFDTGQVITVRTLCTGKRGRIFTNAEMVPTQRLIERYFRNESLSKYQYFSNNEMDENDAEPVRFWGPDVMYGPVHSNDDIYIRQMGGGNNNGWPTFYGKVTTAKRIRVYPSMTAAVDAGVPMDDVFRGGYEEGEGESGHIGFDPDANDLRRNGALLFPDDVDIVAVKLQGTAYTSMYGYINEVGDSTFVVYDIYPDYYNQNTDGGAYWIGSPLRYLAGGDTITIANTVSMKDTVWSSGNSGPISGSVWVKNQLWLEGDVGNYQTWGCADTVYITNDLYYSNTTLGETPDGSDPEDPEAEVNEELVNRTDLLGVVSEEQIIIKYKSIDPFNTGEEPVRVSPNCNDIYMYGAFAAIGDGDPVLYGDKNSHYEGMITFEYQHPHGSTPDFIVSTHPVTGERNVRISYIDLHKYIYTPQAVPAQFSGFVLHGGAPMGTPNVCGYPYPGGEPGLGGGDYSDESSVYNVCHPEYSNPDNRLRYTRPPYGTDYPWYNPVWPEGKNHIVFERGTIHNYGAWAQVRRGFVRRSGGDSNNHVGNAWDMANFHYDGTHPATGYNKAYHYDNRLLYIQPPDYPQVYETWGGDTLTKFNQDNWYFKTPDNW